MLLLHDHEQGGGPLGSWAEHSDIALSSSLL
jgi:hypothetical protein